jgi:hypothetical protein
MLAGPGRDRPSGPAVYGPGDKPCVIDGSSNIRQSDGDRTPIFFMSLRGFIALSTSALRQEHRQDNFLGYKKRALKY